MNSGVIHGCKGDSMCTVCDSFMTLWCLFTQTLGCAFIALRNEWCSLSSKRVFESSIYYSIVISLLSMSTSESMIPRPCF